MTHPIWIVNSALLLLLGCVSTFIYFSDVQIPERESIEPAYVEKKDTFIRVNIQKIYENDLFGTYKKEIEEKRKIDFGPPLAKPPRPERVEIPEPSEPEFLDPLNITLKGIVVVGTHDAKNRAIIEENNTKQERMIKVGDSFEDAQLIRIFKNKIIFLRSNGQQEILYLREQDAKFDPAYAVIDGWQDVIKKIENNSYYIDPKNFVARISNLSQFIQLLGLTTAYKAGKSIGCHIGKVESSSLSYHLGLKTGDIITKINDNQVATVAQRLEAYKLITTQQIGNTITITVLRNNREVALSYTLKYLTKKNETIVENKTTVSKTEARIVKPKNNYAHINMRPTVNTMRSRERQSMMVHGKKQTDRGTS